MRKFLRNPGCYDRVRLFFFGGIAQLGERLTGSQEVRGSSPLISTMIITKAGGYASGLFVYRECL